MIDVVMPRLSDSMEEGTVLTWMKSVGDEVALGEELVEIETDKANMVFESDAAGTLIEIVAAEGDTLPIGEVIARVGSADEVNRSGADDTPNGSTEPAEPVEEPTAIAPRPAPVRGGVKASPLARRIAAAKGIDLSTITGTGPGGRISKADVDPASSQAPPRTPGITSATSSASPGGVRGESPAVEVVELTKLQQTVSRRMAESKSTVPHFYLQADVDMSRCVAAREHLKQTMGEGARVPSFNDMVVRAAAIALGEFPRANGSYRDGVFELHARINIGIAVAAQNALVVPTIFDADSKGLAAIAEQSAALAQRVREGSITPPELAGGTFTVSNLGMYGMRSIVPVINPPQAAILGVGEIAEVPVVRAGQIVPGRVMGLTLSCDHRILYGAEGAQLLARIRALLEEPLGLAL